MSNLPKAVSNIVSNISSHYQNAALPKATSSAPPQFFEHTKKGEVNELKQYFLSFFIIFQNANRLLKNTLNEKDQNKRRDVVKKVIAFMTLGINLNYPPPVTFKKYYRYFLKDFFRLKNEF